MNEFFSEEVVGVIEDYLEGMLEREKTEQQQIRLVPDVFSLPSKDFVELLPSKTNVKVFSDSAVDMCHNHLIKIKDVEDYGEPEVPLQRE